MKTLQEFLTENKTLNEPIDIEVIAKAAISAQIYIERKTDNYIKLSLRLKDSFNKRKHAVENSNSDKKIAARHMLKHFFYIQYSKNTNSFEVYDLNNGYDNVSENSEITYPLTGNYTEFFKKLIQKDSFGEYSSGVNYAQLKTFRDAIRQSIKG